MTRPGCCVMTALISLAALAAAGCSGGGANGAPDTADGSPPIMEAGDKGHDAMSGSSASGATMTDSSGPGDNAVDAGSASEGGATVGDETGTPPDDAATPVVEAGEPPGADASMEASTAAGPDASGSSGDGGAYKPCPGGGAPCAIMPLGDSITYGYGSTTGGGYRVPLFSSAVAAQHAITFVGTVTSGPATVSGKPFPMQNEGHSGYTIDDSTKTKGISPLVDPAIATYKPNIILLMIGTNDMHYSIDLANAPTRLGKLLDQITNDAPKALVVVAKIIPANGAQNTPTQAYNAAIPGVVQPRVAQGKHLVVVDMYAALKGWSSAEYKDSEHPNDTGYALMAQTWYAAIQGVLP